MAFGGSVAPRAQTELWNGTNWTEVNDLGTGRYAPGGVGTQTAALAFGGDNPSASPAVEAVTEKWNGTNWTETTDLNTARKGLGGAGTQTSALGFGGRATDGNATTATEEWTLGPLTVTFDVS